MVGEQSVTRPSFVVDESAPWPSRKRMLDRLIGSISKFVTRRRVDERLAALAAHAASKSRSKSRGRKMAGAEAPPEDDAEIAPARQHPLMPSLQEDDLMFVQRDFQLCTNNVQRSAAQRRDTEAKMRSLHRVAP